ncbi:MAG TPA: hypothetical protein VKQ30_06770 [Ktedonobacterales bacterium]|nr:hypothetical protein [Ktedonobacterales bacterium]
MVQPFWRGDIRLLFQTAMGVFVITVGIGMLNGQHFIKLSQDILLTHVHAGTIGWITLSVMALCLWLFGGDDTPESHRTQDTMRAYIHALSVLAAVSVPVYVVAFFSGNLVARAIFGFPVLAAIVGILVWIIQRSRQIRLTVAHIAILGALVTVTVGAVIGVLLQVEFATSGNFLPSGAFAAHPATMVVGYLLLVGMAISEWRLMPDTGRLPRAGLVQIALPFTAGLVLTVGLLYNNFALLGVNVLFEIVGVVIYIVRFAPRVLRARWLEPTSERYFAISSIFVVVNVALIVYLIGAIVTKVYTDFLLIPRWLVFGQDHAMFIGVMTNALFGLIYEVTRERRDYWRWADHILFWGMNFGMIGFVLSLLANVPFFERVFTPIMGGSILLGLLTYTLRMRATSSSPAVVVAPAAVE